MRERLPAELRGVSRGWMVRSDDRGASWSEPYETPIHNTHGLTPLRDGTLLFLGRSSGTYAYSSNDDGLTWRRLSAIPARPGDKHSQYHELHGVEAASGRIVAHIRNHNEQDAGKILQTVSEDSGRTWSLPAPIGLPKGAYPSHLARLKNGDLLMTYGYRVPPWPIEARVSRDEGETWSNPVTIYDKTERSDMGYPSTVELPDGRLVTVWYEAPRVPRHEAFLQAARWRLIYPDAEQPK